MNPRKLLALLIITGFVVIINTNSTLAVTSEDNSSTSLSTEISEPELLYSMSATEEEVVFESDREQDHASELVQHAGAARQEIAIDLPEGRLGLRPDLKLVYNSNQRRGLLGKGWDLPIGSIERAKKFGLQFSARSFVVINNNNQKDELTQRDWNGDGSLDYYGKRAEMDFTRYEYLQNEDRWLALNRDGTKYYYGSTSDSKETFSAGTFRWGLDKIEDTNGNSITIAYEKVNNIIYPKEITYTLPSPYYKIGLYYQNSSDTNYSYTNGGLQIYNRVIKSIVVKSIIDHIARVYEFSYTTSPGSKISLLAKAIKYGSGSIIDTHGNIIEGRSINILDNTYASSEVGYTNSVISTDKAIKYVAGDFNGDGAIDLAHEPGTSSRTAVIYSYNKSSGSFSRSTGPSTLPVSQAYFSALGNGWNTRLSSYLFAGDFNADGLSDLLSVSSINQSTRRMSFTIAISQPNWTWSTSAMTGPNDIEYGNVGVGDWNGDGLSDIFVGRYCYINNGNGTWGKVRIAPASDYDLYMGSMPIGTQVSNAFETYADINNDGKTDVICFFSASGEDHNTGYFLNTAFTVFMSNGSSYTRMPSAILDNWPISEQVRIEFADMNGDGLKDIIYSNMLGPDGDGNSTAYMLSAINQFNDSYKIKTIYARHASKWSSPDPYFNRFSTGDSDLDGKDEIHFRDRIYISDGNGSYVEQAGGIGIDARNAADLNGDGLLDYFGKNSSTGTWIRLSSYDQYPDVLTTFKNEFGGTTRYSYTTSSAFATTCMPFVLPVVTRVEKDNGINAIHRFDYTYSGGLYNFREREFLGFATMSRTRSSDDGTTEEYHFNQDIYRRGLPYIIKYIDRSNVLLKTESNTWLLYNLSSSSRFAFLESYRETYNAASTDYRKESYSYMPTNGLRTKTVIEGSYLSSLIVHRSTYANLGAWQWRETSRVVAGPNNAINQETLFTHYINTGNLHEEKKWVGNTYDPNTELKSNGGYAITTYKYDSYGNVIEITDPKGNTTTKQWDPFTFTYLIKLTKPKTYTYNHAEITAYNYQIGKPKSYTNENGFTTYYEYDPFADISRITFPDGGSIRYLYVRDAFPRSIGTYKYFDSNYSFTFNLDFYDGFNRKIRSVSPANIYRTIVDTTYNWNGTVLKQYGPYATSRQANYASYIYSDYNGQSPSDCKVVEYIYDGIERLTAKTMHDNQNGSYSETYSYYGLRISKIDPDGKITRYNRDCLGRIVQIRETNRGEDYFTNYAYDVAGNLVVIRKHDGSAITSEYDGLGKKIKQTDPDLGGWYYAYDKNGNLTCRKDNKSQLTYYQYDGLNRLTKKEYSPYSYPVVYNYDSAINGIGLPSYVDNYHFRKYIDSYDKMGRLTQETKGSAIIGGFYTFKYAHDLAGRVVAITYPDDYRVQNVFWPNSDNLKEVVDPAGKKLAQIIDYEPDGKIGSILFLNGSSVSYTYDRKSSRITKIIASASNGSILSDRDYYYSKAGDIIEIVDNVSQADQIYLYDDLHRLLEEVNNNNGDYVSYGYDPVGNITSQSLYSHDPGVLRRDQVPSRTVYYNAENMPNRIEQTVNGVLTAATFRYDGDSRRVSKIVSGKTNHYIDNLFEILNGVPTKYIFAGNLRIAKITPQGTTYFHKDHLGSSTLMTNAAGSLVEKSDYMPFGQTRYHQGTDTTGYKFTDQELDPETGLYYYDARYYDPVAGRFISPDLELPDVYDPQQLNRFAYCRNNPLIYVDPTGHYNSDYGDNMGGFGGLGIGNPGSHGGMNDPNLSEWGNWNGNSNDNSASFINQLTYSTWSIGRSTYDDFDEWFQTVDVGARYGIDSPIGGVLGVTYHNKSLNELESSFYRTTSSLNAGLLGINLSARFTMDPKTNDIDYHISLTTPLLGGRYNVDDNEFKIALPQINYQPSPGVNMFFGMDIRKHK